MNDRKAGRRDTAAPSPWFRRLLIGGGVVLGPELLANLASTVFASTPPGVWLARHSTVLGIIAGVVIVVLVVAYLADRARRRRRLPAPPGPPPVPTVAVEPLRLPAWERFPTRIHDREAELEQALDVVRARGAVAIVGPAMSVPPRWRAPS